MLLLFALLLAGGAVVAALFVVGAPRGTQVTAAGPITGEATTGASTDGYAVWARNADGTPVRWDPCRTIEVVVSDVGGPDHYPTATLVADLEEAVARLRAVTGLRLTVTGTTDEVPDGDRSTLADDTEGPPRWAPVLVGWRNPGYGGLPLRDVDRGVAVPVAVGTSDERVYVTGQVVLNPQRADLAPGFDDRATSWGATLVHELAHVLGLAHVDDRRELLHTYPGEGAVVLGPGDTAGLAAVGAGGGCVEAPTPRHLEVAVPDR